MIVAEGIVKGNATPIFSNNEITAVILDKELVFLRPENGVLREVGKFNMNSYVVEAVKLDELILLLTEDSAAYLFSMLPEPKLLEKRKLDVETEICGRTVSDYLPSISCISESSVTFIMPTIAGTIKTVNVPIEGLDLDAGASLTRNSVVVVSDRKLHIYTHKGKPITSTNIECDLLPYFALTLTERENAEILYIGGIDGASILKIEGDEIALSSFRIPSVGLAIPLDTEGGLVAIKVPSGVMVTDVLDPYYKIFYGDKCALGKDGTALIARSGTQVTDLKLVFLENFNLG